MNNNEQNDFFESEPVKQLLLEAHNEGYISIRINYIEFKENTFGCLCKMSDGCFTEYVYMKHACRFIDDVVNGRFDLHTLSDTQFKFMYRHFIIEHTRCSLMSKIKEYRNDIYGATIYLLPNYFTIKPEQYYFLEFMTAKEAYAKLCDVIDVAKTYTLLCRTGAEEVFYSKLMLVADERKKIELNA